MRMISSVCAVLMPRISVVFEIRIYVCFSNMSNQQQKTLEHSYRSKLIELCILSKVLLL